MITNLTIYNQILGDVVHIGPVHTVGGEEGIFGIYKEDDSNLVHLVQGDDGYWTHLYSFDEAWLWKIYSVIFQFYMDWKIDQEKKSRPKKGI